MPTRDEARRRHASHYAHLLARMKQEYVDGAARDDVVDRFDREWEQLRAGQAWASGAAQAGSGDADLAFVFASNSDPLVGLRHPPTVLREWIAPALAHTAANRDPGVIAENLNRIGLTHYNAGEYESARQVWRQALEMHRRVDAGADPQYFQLQEAGYESNLGSAAERLGDLGAARAAYERALGVFQELGERQPEGRAWMNLGTVLAEEDAHEEAIEAYRRAAQIAEQTDDTDGVELALGAMGNSLVDLGRFDEARTTLERALKLTRDLGDKARRALRLGNLANALYRQGASDDALQHRFEALALAKEMGDPRTEGLQLHGIGQIHAARQDYDEARARFAEAERIFAEIGMTDAAAKSRRGAGETAKLHSLEIAIAAYNERIAAGRYAEAIDALDRWTALGHEQSPYQRSMLIGLYGFAAHVARRLERAAELFAQALALDRELPPDELAANHLGNVGDLYRDLGDARHAESAYRAALQVTNVSDDMRTKLAHGLQLAQELGAERRDPGMERQQIQDVAVEITNRRLRGDAVDVRVTYLDGSMITGRTAYFALTADLPEISVELPGGLPLELAFGRIAAMEVLS